MSSKEPTILIPGDYQYRATLEGHPAQRAWHLEKHARLRAFLQGKAFTRICDAGCGSGLLTRLAAEVVPAARVVGCDISEPSVRFANQTLAIDSRLRYEVRDLLSWTVPADERFDCIFSMEVIEHFDPQDVDRYFDTLRNLGSPGASYLITTPDYGTLWPLIEWSLDRLHLVPPLRDHQHLSRFTRRTLADTVGRHGFRIERLERFCGLAPLLAGISESLASGIGRLERRIGYGNLLICELIKPA